MSDKIYDILTNPNTAIRSTSCPVARIWRNILADLGITPIHFNELLNAYLNDPANGVPKDKRSHTRGNRLKELARDEMTWDLLMKGLKILDPEFAEFSIMLRWSKTHTTYHSIGMPMKPLAAEEHAVTTEEGNKVTMKIPPLSESRWSAVQTGIVPGDSDHLTVTYNSERIDDKGEKE